MVSTAVTEMEHQIKRIMSSTYVFLFLMLVSLLLIRNNTPFAANAIKAMIILDGVVWVLLRLGHYELSKLIAIISGNLMVFIMVFNGWPGGDPYNVYGIAMFHLFLLFISSQITNNILYAYISTGFATLSIVLHYFIFAIPGKYEISPRALEAYTVCLGLILISFMVTKKIMAYRSWVIEKAEKESKENFEKTRQLESTNKKLLASYHETRKTYKKYRVLVETAADAIFITQDGIFKFLNQRTVDMLGYSKEALLGKSFHGLIHLDYRDTLLEKHGPGTGPDKPGGSELLKIVTKKGDVLWGQLNRGFILWEDKPATLNYFKDMTEQKKIEAQLRQAQKMEAIGNLAGGIAHDFNNILSGIFGYSQLAKNNLDNPEKASRHIDMVMKAGKKAAEMVQQILTVSRHSKNEKHPVKISLVVKEALKLLRVSMPSTIEIKEDLFIDKFVLADPAKIHQVAMNLCTNAYHAMFETGGILSVRLKEIEICDQARSVEPDLPPGNYLELEVSDTGHGMDFETRQKIFDPYFTTKGIKEGSQKGSGFGLALVSGIVEEHNGYIKVSSEPGQGSSFYVYLPVVEKSLEAKEPGKKEVIKGGTERIMVVDDDEDILFSIQALLKDYGYNVDIFKNGLEAFEAFERAPDLFDLIITDMTMPLMTGWTLALKVLEKRPEQQIFICTGYSESINKEKALSIGISSYFEKPLIMNDLLKEIRSCLI